MNITINITPPKGYCEVSDDGSFTVKKLKKRNKSRFYKQPSFWLLLVFIVSMILRVLSKRDKKILTEILEDDSSPLNDFNAELESDKKSLAEEQKNCGEYSEEVQISTDNAEKTKKGKRAKKSEKKPEIQKSKNSFRFILNTATKRYHTKVCGAVGKLADEKRGEADIEAESLEQAKEIMEQQGYTMCGLCDR